MNATKTHFEGPVDAGEGLKTDALVVDGAEVNMASLPTSNPGPGRLWIDTTAARVIKVGT